MRSRSLTAVVTAGVVLLGGLGELTPPAIPAAFAQDFRTRAQASYSVSRIYDRVTDSTRVSAALGSTSRPFRLGSRAWLSISFTVPGKQLQAAPAFVVLAVESWTPPRGGWAFARPRELKVEAGKTRLATIAAEEYVKGRVHLLDSGRREELSFRISAEELAVLAQEPELVWKAGSAVIRMDRERMARLRAVVTEMTGTNREFK